MSSDQTDRRWWEPRRVGRPNLFEEPEQLWAAAVEYFEWVEDTPLMEERIFSTKRGIVRGDVAKMRAMTVEGMCLFLGCAKQTWYEYAARPEFADVAARIADVIRVQKFTGAAADLLNSNIIARDLGLAERTENRHTVTNDDAERFTSKIAELASRGPEGGASSGS